MSAAAMAFARSELAVERVAEAYRRAIVDVAAGDAVRGRVAEEVAAAVAAVGIDPSSAAGRELHDNLRSAGL